MSNPSPICTVNAASTLNGKNVTAASTVTIALADTAGVKSWSISCITTDDLLVAATVTSGLTINNTAKTATFTAPAAGSTLRFQSKVNGGLDANGVVDPSLTTTFGVFVLTTSGYRVIALDQTTEGSAAFGWIVEMNAVIRNNLVTPASAGAGLVFSAGAYDIVAADSSITVNANSIQVGVISDAQHGSRGNGSLHSGADGTHAGFMSAAHYLLLNTADVTATPATLALRDGAGSCSFFSLIVGGTLGVTGNATFSGLMQFATGVTGPTLKQADNTTNSATAQPLTIQAANATGTSATGGNIDLVPGTGTLHNGNIALFGVASAGGGEGVIFIKNRTAAPSSNPTNGGILWCESGALKFRGSSGTVTTIANA